MLDLVGEFGQNIYASAVKLKKFFKRCKKGGNDSS